MIQVLYLPQYESLIYAPTIENTYAVPAQLLTWFAATAFSICITLVRNNTKFAATPKNASVTNPWFTVDQIEDLNTCYHKKINKNTKNI